MKIKANYNKINTSHSLECLFKNKNKTNKSVDEDKEKLESSYISGESVK